MSKNLLLLFCLLPFISAYQWDQMEEDYEWQIYAQRIYVARYCVKEAKAKLFLFDENMMKKDISSLKYEFEGVVATDFTEERVVVARKVTEITSEYEFSIISVGECTNNISQDCIFEFKSILVISKISQGNIP